MPSQPALASLPSKHSVLLAPTGLRSYHLAASIYSTPTKGHFVSCSVVKVSLSYIQPMEAELSYPLRTFMCLA